MSSTIAYFTQDAANLFEPIAGLNNAGIMASFFNGLSKTREYLMQALEEAHSDGKYEDLCHHFQMGTSTLMAILDGLASYIEKKVKSPPKPGLVYWASSTTFIDPRFSEIRTIQQRTNDYILKGGITANTLRNFSKHYLPWLPLADNANGMWDIRFPIDSCNKSGPIFSGLLFPLFNDAVDAYIALGKLLSVEAQPIPRL